MRLSMTWRQQKRGSSEKILANVSSGRCRLGGKSRNKFTPFPMRHWRAAVNCNGVVTSKRGAWAGICGRSRQITQHMQ